MNTSTDITLIEVGPRDGLQNISTFIPTEMKVQFIQDLGRAGLQHIEATSFVSPRWIPQMADHQQVLEQLPITTQTHYHVLVPNLKGAQTAIDCGAKHLSVFTAASDAFSRKNTNRSIKDSLEDIQDIITLAQTHDIPVRSYLSCIIDCPYGESIQTNTVITLTEQLINLGSYQVSLGDTLGNGTPDQLAALTRQALRHLDPAQIALHCHDTKGLGIENIKACLSEGATTFDSSAAGLGGCPYAPGASGNVATEDVVKCLEDHGITTHIDLDALIQASQPIITYIKNNTPSTT